MQKITQVYGNRFGKQKTENPEDGNYKYLFLILIF